jgi:TrmH family RNA methyltransferase
MEMRVVLVRPRYAGNLGAVLRVAANFGVSRVALVAPSVWMDDPAMGQMAMGADRLVEMSEHETLAAALDGVEVAVATTSARTRDPRAILAPAEVRARLAAAGVRRTAIVFGSERGGLDRRELRACQLSTAVPTRAEFPVLNLAQAVAIVLALLTDGRFPLRSATDERDAPAPGTELAEALAQLEATLLATGFLDPVNPARVMDQLRRLFGRALPTHREVAIVRGLAAHLDYMGGRVSRTD